MWDRALGICGIAISFIFYALPHFFPTSPKWASWTGMAIGIGMLIGAGILFVMPDGNIEKTILVSPAEIRIVSSKWKTTQPFDITNNSGKTKYQIWVKLSAASRLIDVCRDLAFDGALSPNDPVLSIPGLDWGTDMVMGGTDSNGEPAMLVNLYKLTPGQTRSFSLSAIGAEPQNVFLSTKFLSSSDQPAQINRTENATGVNVRMPETFHSHCQIVHVAPNGNK